MNEILLVSGTQFNKLRLKYSIMTTLSSTKSAEWVCDCGKSSYKIIGNVTKGNTKSCGRCNEISAEEMTTRKFGKLRMKNPAPVTSGSGKRMMWICDCGKEVKILIHSVFFGTSSCGHCDDAVIDSQKFGKLKIKVPGIFSPSSHKKVWWTCDCGREAFAEARNVITGTKQSCGRCNEITLDKMTETKFNRLRMKNPTSVTSGSCRKIECICDCSREIVISVFRLVNNKIKSCGKCSLTFRQKYEANKSTIMELKTPITPDQLPDWCPIALETITKVSKPFRANCRLCGDEYFPRWSGVRSGSSLTCGCSSSRISGGQNEIFNFVSGFDSKSELEYKVGDLKYDIFIPSKNLLIEYNGLKWHSKPSSKKRDIEKYRNAITHKYDYLMIFEDEWHFNRKKIENLIRNKLVGVSKKLRPQQCEIRRIDHKKADELYESNHYIGKVKTKINYGVYFNNELIGCCSFKHPTRQSSHDWEIARMVSVPQFRVHGIWSKILRIFITEYQPKSIVSFSDNRLFTGAVYEKMGFKFDGEIRPDYYWYRSDRRYNKSNLRKTTEEKTTGKSEVELRIAQGYSKIWDLGKKRWVLQNIMES